MKQENSHRRRLWFLECLWSWKWLLRGFLWRRREATAHNHNANLSPLFFSSVLPLTWLPNAPKCSRTTWRFATTYYSRGGSSDYYSLLKRTFSFHQFMGLHATLADRNFYCCYPLCCFAWDFFVPPWVSFIIAESRNAARHFRRRNELLFGKHWNWRKMHFNSLRSKASFSFNNCVSFEANKPR